MTFSFHRGCLALDFVGTVGSRASAAPEERLPHRAALGTWLVEAGLLRIVRPGVRDLERARVLREAIYAIATAMLARRRPEAEALSVLNAAARGLRLGTPRLTASGGLCWVSRAPVRTALARVAMDAIDRLTGDLDRLTVCELEGCGALLLSRSRSDRRRWCSMDLCGNRAKAAAHRARRRRSDGEPIPSGPRGSLR